MLVIVLSLVGGFTLAGASIAACNHVRRQRQINENLEYVNRLHVEWE